LFIVLSFTANLFIYKVDFNLHSLFTKAEHQFRFFPKKVLPDDPERLLETGNYHRVPLIIGSNSDEGILNLAAYLQGNIEYDDVDKVKSKSQNSITIISNP
jgi:carboxylesterase type B